VTKGLGSKSSSLRVTAAEARQIQTLEYEIEEYKKKVAEHIRPHDRPKARMDLMTTKLFYFKVMSSNCRKKSFGLALKRAPLEKFTGTGKRV
jgi:hypothetical protein